MKYATINRWSFMFFLKLDIVANLDNYVVILEVCAYYSVFLCN